MKSKQELKQGRNQEAGNKESLQRRPFRLADLALLLRTCCPVVAHPPVGFHTPIAVTDEEPPHIFPVGCGMQVFSQSYLFEISSACVVAKLTRTLGHYRNGQSRARVR